MLLDAVVSQELHSLSHIQGNPQYSADEPGCLHGNSHFVRQFRYFTRKFSNSNDNLTMKELKIRITKMICCPGIQDSKTVFKYEIRPD